MLGRTGSIAESVIDLGTLGGYNSYARPFQEFRGRVGDSYSYMFFGEPVTVPSGQWHEDGIWVRVGWQFQSTVDPDEGQIVGGRTLPMGP